MSAANWRLLTVDDKVLLAGWPVVALLAVPWTLGALILVASFLLVLEAALKAVLS